MYRTLGRFRWRSSRYRKEIARLTKLALQAKLARGERAGNIAYGYALAPDGRTLEPCIGEREVVEAMTSLRASGCSLRQIAAELNRRGFTTRRGTAWRFGYVRNVLKRAA